MSYNFYLFFHILGLIIVFASLGGVVSPFWEGGNKENLKIRKPLSRFHGIALLIVFVSGFGLMARGGFSFTSSYWVYVKLLVWLTLGAFPVLIYKKVIPAKFGIVALTVIGTIAIYTVIFKPI